MSKRQRQKVKVIGVLLVIAGAMLALLIGGLVYTLLHVSVRALRWWAGLATAALPILGALTFWLGRVEARGRLVGLEQGVSTVMKAAQQTADLRAAQVREARRPVDAPLRSANAPDIVIVPANHQALPGEGSGKILEL